MYGSIGESMPWALGGLFGGMTAKDSALSGDEATGIRGLVVHSRDLGLLKGMYGGEFKGLGFSLGCVNLVRDPAKGLLAPLEFRCAAVERGMRAPVFLTVDTKNAA